ncbi:MAG: hypothetical protein ABI599_03850 [Flavobacteriales bacterium]
MKHLASIAIAVTVVTALAIDMDLRLWERRDRVIEHDVHGYYGYLPAIFIYEDIRLEKRDYRQEGDYYLVWLNTSKEGYNVIKYPCGLAVMYSPFFVLAHISAQLVGDTADGSTALYKVGLIVCALFYLGIGLLLLRAALRQLGFTETSVAITLLMVGVGTNLLCYASQSSTMPHVHGFFLFSAFLLLTIRWYQSPSLKDAVLLGITFGLIVLVRPTNAVFGLVFPLYGVGSWPGLAQRFSMFRRKWSLLLVMVLTAFLVWTPQFAYWHAVTGQWVYYSYQDEGFFFGHPHLWEGLAGFRKGWLVYTPVMAFALGGIVLLRNKATSMRSGVVTVILLHVYITLSWWCWWYGGTYGQRSMVETYALLAIPLCALVERAIQWRLALRLGSAALAVFFIWLNIFQTYQFEIGSLHHDAMTAKLYFHQFGRSEKIPDFDSYLEHPDYDRARTTGR